MQIARSVVVFGGTQIFTVIAALVRNKVAAVVIGTAGVGLNGLFLSISNFIGNLSNFGISASCVPDLSRSYANADKAVFCHDVSVVRQITLVTATIGMLLTVAVSPLLSWFYFGDNSYLLSFASLALVVGSAVVVNNEMSIMKSMGKTKMLAWQIVLTAVISVVFVVPFFLLWQIDGVIWALATSSVANAVLVVMLSNSVCPVEFRFEPFLQFCQSAKPMFVLGMTLVVTSLVTYATELLLQSFFETMGGLESLGLFRAGYQLSVVYTGMIFTAVNNDFFPRLSMLAGDIDERNALIWRQIKVLLLFTVPLISLFAVVVPWVVPLLYSNEFDPVIGMVRWASLGVIVKGIYMPIGYLPLVLKKSTHFFVLELVSCSSLVMAVIAGYYIAGCDGIGIGILLCNIVDAIWVYSFCRIKYKFH